jgi:hypothetical protein
MESFFLGGGGAVNSVFSGRNSCMKSIQLNLLERNENFPKRIYSVICTIGTSPTNIVSKLDERKI